MTSREHAEQLIAAAKVQDGKRFRAELGSLQGTEELVTVVATLAQDVLKLRTGIQALDALTRQADRS